MQIPFPLLTDSYKCTHYSMYPPGTEKVYSYFESRGGSFPETVFVGLQGLLREHFSGPRVTEEGVFKAENILRRHFGRDLMNKAGWQHIITDHRGLLPLVIHAVPEGTPVPLSNVLMTVENTCPQCYWLTNYAETLLVQAWYPTTVATISRAAKKIILRYLERTGDPGLIDFKLHDFGFRGVSSVESAAIGAFAHLVNFKGTDTLAGVDYAYQYYNDPCAGFSIPATEHSVVTINGPEGELDAFRRVLNAYPTGLVACVSDSYDIWRACSEYWGTILKEQVMQRDGTLVVRPDSGYPPKVVLEVVQRLGKAFGYTTNEKGYKVLDPHVRVIQGDGVNLSTIEECLHQLQFNRWSADNIAFGMGGALLQKCDRDTLQFAFKCSSRTINGVEAPVWKEPVGDTAKNSKRGRLALVQTPEGLRTVQESTLAETGLANQLVEVWRDGVPKAMWSLEQVRAHAALPVAAVPA